MKIKLYTRAVGGGPELSLRVGAYAVRLCWGQVALWKSYEPIVNWLNPFVWYRIGAGLHLRGKPIEHVDQPV